MLAVVNRMDVHVTGHQSKFQANPKRLRPNHGVCMSIQGELLGQIVTLLPPPKRIADGSTAGSSLGEGVVIEMWQQQSKRLAQYGRNGRMGWLTADSPLSLSENDWFE